MAPEPINGSKRRIFGDIETLVNWISGINLIGLESVFLIVRYQLVFACQLFERGKIAKRSTQSL